MDSLVKQRSACKGSMTKILNFANALTDRSEETIDDIKERLSYAHKLLDRFHSIEDKLLGYPEKESQIDDFENTYYPAVSKLNTWLRKRQFGIESANFNDTANQSMSQNVSNVVKYCKIEIPVFSGDYTEWTSFIDLFNSGVHNNEAYTPSQKFQLLVRYLRGEALDRVRHLKITDANYIEAIQRLSERYDRKKYIINSFIRDFLNISNISSANANNIRKTHDIADTVVRGLHALGNESESRHPWLIYLLLERLDDSTKALWAKESADVDIPTIDEFLKFLDKRADTFESTRTFSSSSGPSKRNQEVTTKTKSFLSTSEFSSCPLCKIGGHRLSECPKFKEMPIEEKRHYISKTNRCFNCLSIGHRVSECRSKIRCQNCHRRHHTAIHENESKTTKQAENKDITVTSALSQSRVNSSAALFDHGSTRILPTAIVRVTDEDGVEREIRTMLDSCSQTSFITNDCVQRLGLKRRNSRVVINGIGAISAGSSKGVVTVCIRPRHGIYPQIDKLTIEALILPIISSSLPDLTMKRGDRQWLEDIPLADPHFNDSSNIELLLGVDVFFHILEDGQMRSPDGHLVAQKTKFGWVIGGGALIGSSEAVSTYTTTIDIDAALKRFWEIEEVTGASENYMTPEEQNCVRYYEKTTTRTPEGRFVTRLPFKESTNELSSTFNLALRCLESMERRFERDPNLRRLYIDFLDEYESLGHMSKVSGAIDRDAYFMPHHGVLKQTSSTTKLRVVYNASAKCGGKKSLNQVLMKGPTVQPSLHEIILKFRIFQYVLTGDIEKMFRQVLVHDQDQKYQLILWRKSPKEDIAAYKLKTVTYGTTSASFVTTYTINQLAKQFEVTKPEAAKVVRQNIYVDDLMIGAESASKLLKLKRDVVEVLSSGGFNLRKFTTNDAALRKLLNSEPDTSTKTLSEHPDAVRVLGIRWNPEDDAFMFSVDMPVTEKHTKRTFLSEVSQIFDPHGWLSPLLIRPKMLLQSLWLCKLDWDDELPVDVAKNWQEIRADIVNAAAIRIPRWLEITEDLVVHGFCDASEKAYASVIYVQSIRNGEYSVKLVGGKSRVAPLKQRSLPQLELLGAQLLTNHMKAILDQIGLCPREICLWTDSNIVLDWLSSHPGRWKTFVANRVSVILDNYSRDVWRHVPTKHNPADCATRGLSVAELLDFSLWWKGPDFLHKPIEQWPQQKGIAVTEHLYERKSKAISHVSSTESNDFLQRLVSTTSKYRKLLHTVSYLRRVFTRPENKPKHKHLSVEEVNEAELWLCRETQKIYFKEDYERLMRKASLSKKGPLLELSPFLDEYEVMRVGGRLQKSLAHYNRKHPIILHARADLTLRIVYHYHQTNCHPGPGLLLQLIREKFWIIRGRDLMRRIFRNCIRCIRYRPKMQEQLMGELPIERVRMTYPFACVGLDFAGPFRVHPFRRRGATPFKAYLCIIVCLATKAVHLECCMELSTQSFLGALKRFVSRRGLCNTILCDNGTNFVGTANYLKDLQMFLNKNNENIFKSLLDSQITWKFNPPGAPHMGGMWEAAVRSTKTLLKRTVGEHILTLEEFTTLSCQIESILNSRPISITSSDDLDLLTPAHFLIHRTMNQVPDVVPEERLTANNRWDIVRRIVTHFWKRWHVEFLSTLQQKSKWKTGKPDIKLDDIVLIQNNNLPPGQWQLGRIVETHVGADGRVRVVTVKTLNGNIRRPITKISILPVNESGDSWPAGCLGSTNLEPKIGQAANTNN